MADYFSCKRTFLKELCRDIAQNKSGNDPKLYSGYMAPSNKHDGATSDFALEDINKINGNVILSMF